MQTTFAITSILEIATDSPWKFFNELGRLVLLPFIFLYFWFNNVKWGRNWKIYGFPILQIHRGSKVQIGSGLELRSSMWSNPLAPFHPVVISTRAKNAQIIIGNNFKMTGGALVAEESITIGNNVTCGANSSIFDTDFHPIKSSERNKNFLRGKHAPISIDNGVFIGTQSLILKGTKIGDSSVVGAGSIVVGNFEKKSMIVSHTIKSRKI